MRLRAIAAALAAVLVRAFDLRDLFVFGGIGCAGYGIAQVYVPAAWLVVGAALFWLGIRKN